MISLDDEDDDFEDDFEDDHTTTTYLRRAELSKTSRSAAAAGS